MKKTPKTTQSKLPEPTTTPVAPPKAAKWKRVPGWHENQGPKCPFYTSEDFAAYPRPDGRFDAYKINESLTLTGFVGVFDKLENIKVAEPAKV